MRQCPKKMHKVIKFNQRAWLKQYINMKTNRLFKMMNNSVFGKITENVKTFRDIKLGIFIKQKGEEIIWCQNQIITLQSFSQTICWQQK